MHVIKRIGVRIWDVGQCWLIVVVLVSLFTACRHGNGRILILNDFERDGNLNRLLWKCRTAYSLSEKNSTHGRACLKLTVYPSPYPGLHLLLKGEGRDWQGYQKLCLDLFNPGHDELRLCYRLDDRTNPPYADRANGLIMVKPGLNRIKLDLAALRTSGTARRLNWERMQSASFFFVSPQRPITLYVDFIRLQR